MNISVSTLRSLLRPYNYRVVYRPYHSERDIRLYARRKDAVSPKAHLTLITPSGHVMVRLHGLTKKRRFLGADHLGKVVATFGSYDIPSKKRILRDLEALLKPTLGPKPKPKRKSTPKPKTKAKRQRAS